MGKVKMDPSTEGYNAIIISHRVHVQYLLEATRLGQVQSRSLFGSALSLDHTITSMILDTTRYVQGHRGIVLFACNPFDALDALGRQYTAFSSTQVMANVAVPKKSRSTFVGRNCSRITNGNFKLARYYNNK